MVDAISGMLNRVYGPWRGQNIDRLLTELRAGPPG